MTEEQDEQKTDVVGLYTVECPVCGASPGQLCVNLRTGKVLPLRADYSRGHRQRQQHYVNVHGQRALDQIRNWRRELF